MPCEELEIAELRAGLGSFKIDSAGTGQDPDPGYKSKTRVSAVCGAKNTRAGQIVYCGE